MSPEALGVLADVAALGALLRARQDRRLPLEGVRRRRLGKGVRRRWQGNRARSRRLWEGGRRDAWLRDGVGRRWLNMAEAWQADVWDELGRLGWHEDGGGRGPGNLEAGHQHPRHDQPRLQAIV